MTERSNKPPYAVLELSEDEATWLTGTLLRARKLSVEAFKDVASMSSSDPRAVMRASLMMAANIDETAADTLGERLSDQNKKTRDIWEPDQ